MAKSSSCYCPGPCCEEECDCQAIGYHRPGSLCPVGTEDLGDQIVGGQTASGTVCENIKCKVCVSSSDDFWVPTRYSSQPIGNPACTTTANINVYSGCRECQSAEDCARAALHGNLTVDCSNEPKTEEYPNGFCTANGKSGTYSVPGALNTSSTQVFGTIPNRTAKVTFEFEDCGISPADFQITVDLREC